ncbi:MAG: hypothetical protein GY799_08015 [Desulfobulbaceae bacterium]|nr:hypothetical protein [Desulfobulbaceae bacterium]
MDSSTAYPTGFSWIKSALEFLGITTVLVVFMGLPSTIHHHFTFHIPIVLLSYRRVLEAGLFPAILVVLFLAYLFWVEKKTFGHKKLVYVDITGAMTREAFRVFIFRFLLYHS